LPYQGKALGQRAGVFIEGCAVLRRQRRGWRHRDSQRILMDIVGAEFVVEVRARGYASTADETDDIALGYAFAFMHALRKT